jgi:hypothetical protein
MARSRARQDNTPIYLFLGGVGLYVAWQSGALKSLNLASLLPMPKLPTSPTASGSAVPVSTAPAPGRLPTDPRGIRNNNPTNIKYSSANRWIGQVGSDGVFSKFDSPVNGIRAAFIILKQYRARGLDTIDEIASSWAPASENNVGNWASAVASGSGMTRTQKIDMSNPTLMFRLMRGMIGAENGASWRNYFADSVLMQAWSGAS